MKIVSRKNKIKSRDQNSLPLLLRTSGIKLWTPPVPLPMEGCRCHCTCVSILIFLHTHSFSITVKVLFPFLTHLAVISGFCSKMETQQILRNTHWSSRTVRLSGNLPLCLHVSSLLALWAPVWQPRWVAGQKDEDVHLSLESPVKEVKWGEGQTRWIKMQGSWKQASGQSQLFLHCFW